MNFRPKQYYVAKSSVPMAPYKAEGTNVYYRKDDGKLGQLLVATDDYKEARLSAKEALVAEGDCLIGKAVLATIKGGKQ